MLIVGMDAHKIKPKLEELILKYRIGGVMLYKKDYSTYKEMVEMINYIKELNKNNKVPILISIDQECGRVNRMPKEIHNLESQSEVAKKGIQYAKKHTNVLSKMLNHVGINMNFAPVLDLKRFEDNHPIGDRAFSDNVEDVIKFGNIYVNSMKEENIVPVIKHFPGHGATKEDTHFSLSSISNSVEELEKSDLIPFKSLIDGGIDTMLVSHIRINAIDKKLPASMSKKVITSLIRKRYRYNRVLITDDMRMKAIQIFFGKYNAVLKAIKAGNDIILLKYINNDKIIDKILKQVKTGKIKEYKINKSVRRVLKLKEKYNINDKEINYDETFVETINKKIDELKIDKTVKT